MDLIKLGNGLNALQTTFKDILGKKKQKKQSELGIRICSTELMKGVISYSLPQNTAKLLVISHCSLQRRLEPRLAGIP